MKKIVTISVTRPGAQSSVPWRKELGMRPPGASFLL